jgi:hypothetical protein
MLIHVRSWLASEKSWPLLLLVLSLAYWLSPRGWWASFTFILIGIVYLALVAAHGFEFWKIQRKWPSALFIIAYVFFGVAILIGAYTTAPLPNRNVDALRPISRALWAIGLPFFAIAAWFECWRIYRQWKANR